MDDDSKNQEVLKVLSFLVAAFPNSTVTTDNVVAYAAVLRNIPYVQLQAAARLCIRKYKFFPSISELLDAVDELMAAVSDRQLPTSDEAWHEVMTQLNRSHIYHVPIWSCDEIKLAVDTIGWRSICEMEEKITGVTRKHFMDIFANICNRQRQQAQYQLAIGNNRDQLIALVQAAIPHNQMH